jgi:hypothetical protein
VVRGGRGTFLVWSGDNVGVMEWRRFRGGRWDGRVGFKCVFGCWRVWRVEEDLE